MAKYFLRAIAQAGLALSLVSTGASGQISATTQVEDSKLSRTDFYQLLTANETWNAVSLGAAASGLDCAIFARPDSGHTFREEELIDMERNERVAFLTWESAGRGASLPEVSIAVGAPVAPGRDELHVLVVDDRIGFSLIGDGERLVVHPDDDGQIVAALRRGSRMLVQGRLEDGNVVRDTYSLNGLIAATDQMKNRCTQ